MKFSYALVILSAIVSAIIYFGLKPAPASFDSANSALGWREVEIKSEKFHLEVVDSEPSRGKGLSGRDYLLANRGMLFLFRHPARYGFWMKGMKFPLDIIWLNQGRVVYILESAPPDNSYRPAVYGSTADADSVLELNAGEAERLGLKLGDILSLE